LRDWYIGHSKVESVDQESEEAGVGEQAAPRLIPAWKRHMRDKGAHPLSNTVGRWRGKGGRTQRVEGRGQI